LSLFQIPPEYGALTLNTMGGGMGGKGGGHMLPGLSPDMTHTHHHRLFSRETGGGGGFTGLVVERSTAEKGRSGGGLIPTKSYMELGLFMA
jgi:hypothetical protein